MDPNQYKALQAKYRLDLQLGLAQLVPVSPEEDAYYAQMVAAGQPLPPEIFPNMSESITFSRCQPTPLTNEQRMELIAIKQYQKLQSIGAWVTFFGVMAVIILLGGLITALVLLG